MNDVSAAAKYERHRKYPNKYPPLTEEERKEYNAYYRERTQERFKHILERDNSSCQWCGVKEKVSLRVLSRRLIIHHIDGDRTNDSSENLALLCVFCHRKVHTLMKVPTLPEITVENFPKAFAEIWPTEYELT